MIRYLITLIAIIAIIALVLAIICITSEKLDSLSNNTNSNMCHKYHVKKIKDINTLKEELHKISNDSGEAYKCSTRIIDSKNLPVCFDITKVYNQVDQDLWNLNIEIGNTCYRVDSGGWFQITSEHLILWKNTTKEPYH